MALVERRRFDDDWLRNRDSFFGKSMWDDEWHDWPVDWPRPREMIDRFDRDLDHWWKDWPTSWPRMDAVMPALSRNLDRMDSNWREHPFWRGRYPDWAEPVFKDGIDVNSNIVNDGSRFAVDIDCHQFRPEEIEVKTLGDTLMVEGRHEDVRDRDNYTKMYFVRKYQLPRDVDPLAIQSSIDGSRRLTVQAPKRAAALGDRERLIPIEGSSRIRSTSRNRLSPDSGYSNGRGSPMATPRGQSSPRGPTSPLDVHIPYNDTHREREFRDSHRDRADAAFNGDSNFSASRYYHRTESRTSNSLAPHQVTADNENRAFSPRRASFDTRDNTRDATREREQVSPGPGIFDKIRNKFEKGFRSHSRNAESRTESRQSARDYDNGYRVETPVSIPVRREHHASSLNGGERAAGGESRSESVRSIRIERKAY